MLVVIATLRSFEYLLTMLTQMVGSSRSTLGALCQEVGVPWPVTRFPFGPPHPGPDASRCPGYPVADLSTYDGIYHMLDRLYHRILSFVTHLIIFYDSSLRRPDVVASWSCNGCSWVCPGLTSSASTRT